MDSELSALCYNLSSNLDLAEQRTLKDKAREQMAYLFLSDVLTNITNITTTNNNTIQPNLPIIRYFADQDFTQSKLSLPDELLNDIQNGNQGLIDYLKTLRTNTTTQENNVSDMDTQFDNADIYNQICDIYAQILDYYSGCEYYGGAPDNGFWQDDFIDSVWYICTVIYNNYILDPQEFIKQLNGQNTDPLGTEITYGLDIILTNIDMIRTHYMELYRHNNIIEQMTLHNMDTDDSETFIRLVNNLCVILIFIKLYYKYED